MLATSHLTKPDSSGYPDDDDECCSPVSDILATHVCDILIPSLLYVSLKKDARSKELTDVTIRKRDEAAYNPEYVFIASAIRRNI